jgi:hypothetical protein
VTTFERAQLAAVFLSHWVDGAEQANPSRLRKRIDNAFAMADLVDLEALAREHGDSVITCFSCGLPMLAGDAKPLGADIGHVKCIAKLAEAA